MVKKTVAALLAMPLAASLLLTGCGGGDPKPDSGASASSTRSPATTTGPTATMTGRTTSPTTSAPAVDLGIPAAARAHTDAGAEAFVRYFLVQFNRSWVEADPSLLPPLSAPTCKSCGAFISTAEIYRKEGHHQRPAPFNIDFVGLLGNKGAVRQVLVTGVQPDGVIVDSAGAVVRRMAKESLKLSVTLTWTGPGWRIKEVQVMK